jgi:hypothetical protein
LEWTLAAIEALVLRWDESPEWLKSALSRGYPQDPSIAPRAGTRPSRGIITRYPLFAALCSQPLPDFEAPTRIAQAALVVCVALLEAHKGTIAPYMSAVQGAGRAARRISVGQYVPPELIEALNAPPSLGAVLARIDEKSVALKNLPEDEARLVTALRVLLLDAVKFRTPRKRNQSEHGTTRRRRHGDIESIAPDHDERQEEFEPADEDLSEGGAAVPESPRRRVVTVGTGSARGKDTDLSPAQRQWRAKERARGIASSAQGLMLGSDRMHLVDLEAFEAAIQRHLTGEKRLSDSAARGALAASVSLLCGRSIERLKDFAIVHRIGDIPSRVLKPYFVTSESVIIFPAPTLEKAFTPSASEAACYRPVSQRLILPAPMNFAFSSLLIKHAETAVGTRPFAKGEWMADLDQFTGEVNLREHSRLTAVRIAEFLERQVVVTNGDWADAALFCASGDSNARLYYYSPTHKQLRDLWLQLWRGVGVGLGRRDLIFSTLSSADDGLGFCSRGCPTHDGVKAMVTELLAHCRETLRGRRNTERVRKVHNVIASYTVLMVLWHSGSRAVNDPVDLALYDPSTGFLALSDKDTDAYYASRVVWLPEVVQRQIAAYKSHLKALRTGTDGISVPAADTLFFYDAEGAPSTIDLGALKAALPAKYPYRLNAQRHYHRTMLKESRVFGQVIDAHLGHGAPGQEPYAVHSCFSPQRLQLELGPALTELSESAGWQVLNGLG